MRVWSVRWTQGKAMRASCEVLGRRDEEQRLADTRRSENPGLAFPANPKRPERATVIRPPWGKSEERRGRKDSRWRGATKKQQKATPRRSAAPQKATPC